MDESTMTIMKSLGGFTVEYGCGAIEKVYVSEYTSTLRFYTRSKEESFVDVSQHVELSVGYNSQFGISLTEDGVYFFVQSWEKGLFCFHRQTGKLCWHCKCKHAYKIIVTERILICHFLECCIKAFEIKTGSVIANYPMTVPSVFIALGDNSILIGPKRNKMIILSHTLQEIIKIPYNLFNTNMSRVFLLHSAEYSDDGLWIQGMEYSNGEDLKTSEPTMFSRVVIFNRCNNTMDSSMS